MNAWMPKTRAGHLALIESLLHPVDEDGNPLPPVISPEDARRFTEMVEAEPFFGTDRGDGSWDNLRPNIHVAWWERALWWVQDRMWRLRRRLHGSP
jgi:hypothetical protein